MDPPATTSSTAPTNTDEHIIDNTTDLSSSSLEIFDPVLSQCQIEEYCKRGVLVVNDVLSAYELQQALLGMESSLRRRGVNTDILMKKNDNDDYIEGDEGTEAAQTTTSSTTNNDKVLSSIHAFQQLSSTNGSGGVLDIFWDDWKLEIMATNSKLFRATTQLWKAVYDNGGDNDNNDDTDVTDNNNPPTPLPKSDWRWHPYMHENIDFNRGYAYIDRVGYRLPTVLSEQWGELLHEDNNNNNNKNELMNGNTPSHPSAPKDKQSKKKKKKHRSVQRSLTPHLDCCPETYFHDVSDASSAAGSSTSPKKWRPIQCFVALTDTLHSNEGGFECVPTFHHEFYEWSQRRRHQPTDVKTSSSSQTVSSQSSLCVGEYTHIRPKEDHNVMSRIEHIPIPAGAAVFWDNRLPHANSYKNNKLSTTSTSLENDDTDTDNVATTRLAPARQVVYCSFLPDIALNRQYVANQLVAYRTNQPIRDQWNHIPTTKSTSDHIDDDDDDSNDDNANKSAAIKVLSPLGQKLMGIVPWD